MPSPAQWGPGRFDALGRGGNTVFSPLNPDNLRPANASVSIPPLWGVWEYDWVQWAGSIQHPLARNIAQVIGVNAALFCLDKNLSARCLQTEKRFFGRRSMSASLKKHWRTLAKRLHPPRWPASFPPINRELAGRGKDLYHGNKRQGPQNLCAHCHVATKLDSPNPNGPKPARHDDATQKRSALTAVSGEFFPTYRGSRGLLGWTDSRRERRRSG
jgi:hypothetical protein